MPFEQPLTCLLDWCSIPTSQDNPSGQLQLLNIISSYLKPLCDEIAIKPVSEGSASLVLTAKKHGKSEFANILLFGHIDTVFAKTDDFHNPKVEGSVFFGAGCADMKGGLWVMLEALYLLSENPTPLGWTVVINSDEEISSKESAALWPAIAKEHDFGLGFEPALPDRTLATSRRGSINLQICIEGKAAHPGRDPRMGINALFAAAELIAEMERISLHLDNSCWMTISSIEGGGAFNVIPASAKIGINLRTLDETAQKSFFSRLQALNEYIMHIRGVKISSKIITQRPPKISLPLVMQVAKQVQRIGLEENLEINFGATAGVCDGNNFQFYGLPNLDNLGPVGGGLHSHNEWIDLDSLVAQSQIVFKLLKFFESNSDVIKKKPPAFKGRL